METAADGTHPLELTKRQRGSMAMVTQQTREIGLLRCEKCSRTTVGGLARGVILEEPAGDTGWLLWVLADGWSISGHGDIAVCPDHQSDPLLRVIRFAQPA